MCGSAFAQTSTGPAAQGHDMNDPGTTNGSTMDKGSMNSGATSSGSVNNTTGMNKGDPKKEMSKGRLAGRGYHGTA